MPCEVLEIDEVVDHFSLTSKTVVVIGKGQNKNKYIWGKNISVFFINDSMLPSPKCPEEYPSAYDHTSVIVETHFPKNYPLVNFHCKSIIYIRKIKMTKLELIAGCTPSLFISYLIKHTGVNRILLQGFSFDGVSPINDPFPYDWSRQYKTIGLCFELAREKKVEIGFVTPCTAMEEFRHYTEEETKSFLE